MAKPPEDKTNKPGTPKIYAPISGNIYEPGILRIVWSDLLALATISSWYTIQIDDDANFSSPASFNIYKYQNKAFLDFSFTEATWYIRVKTTKWTQGDDQDGYFIISEWSPVVQIVVDLNIAPGQIGNVLKDNQNKFVPIMYGSFDRKESGNDNISNGLAVAYLGDFMPNPLYYYASHGTNPSTEFNLHIPITGNTVIPATTAELIPLFWGGATHPDISGSALALPDDTSSTYILRKDFSMSDATLAAPYGGGTGRPWYATNRDNVFDDNANTIAVIKFHDSNEVDSDDTFDYWNTSGGAAWEVNDPFVELPDMLGTSGGQLWVHYRNLHIDAFDFSPRKIDGETKISIRFLITNWANPNDLTQIIGVPVGSHIPVFNQSRFDRLTWEPSGPMTAAQLTSKHTTNRRFALAIMIASETYAEMDSTGSIGDLKLEARVNLTFKELKEILTVYVSGDGRFYRGWISNFNTKLGEVLNNRVTDAMPGLVTIEDPAMIVASLLFDYVKIGNSDIDAQSFTDGISLIQKMRMNIIEDGTTVRDAIVEICKQTPFTFVFTPSGKAKLVNLRTTSKEFSADVTIPYKDIEVRTFKLSKSPLEDVVNNLEVKSRFQAEKDDYINFDNFTNSSSDTKHGTKKSKGALEWRGLNSGPYKRNKTNNFTGPFKDNPVKIQATHLIDPNIVNKVTDNFSNNFNDGWWSNQHTQVEVFLPGYKYMKLEAGDLIALDETSFSAHDLKCFGTSWTGKKFRIQNINKTDEGVFIKNMIQKPDIDTFWNLRGVSGFWKP